MRIKKGKVHKSKIERIALYTRLFKTHWPERNKDTTARFLCWESIGKMRDFWKEFQDFREKIPERIDKNYDIESFKIDCENVNLHYTKWVREDHWDAKKSLQRVKRYAIRKGISLKEVLRVE